MPNTGLRLRQLLVALPLAFTAPANAAMFGTDTRALHFIGSTGFQYAGGYLDDFQEYDGTPNGAISDTLSTTFSGTLNVGNGLEVPTSAYHFASADLATGKLKAYATDPVVSDGNGQSYFTQGRSNASFADTLSFTFAPTVTEQYVKIGLRTKIEGTYASNGPGSAGSMSTELRATNDQYAYQYGGYLQKYWGGGNADYSANGMTDYGNNIYGYDIMVATTPFNLTILNLLSVNAYGSTVDYSHTATFGLVLPEGVSYTSASGVFLTGATAAVPEPASWALMIGGFGIAGGALRRRQPARRRAGSLAA